ncbi:DUF3499 domain-containing protein [Aestuariimicrobium sp. Y1814]|uniref:DUF3499 domain-containing protein n=1 Tax=Aestuariimicrobium sp. Y1814 TaxID=3418742 RepID=UPI003DA6E18B
MRRWCSRTACSARATTTLTFDYAGQLAVVGPLSPSADPSAYDLCRRHADKMSAPQGWEVVRLPELDEDPAPPVDDLLALADAIREVGLRHDDPVQQPLTPAHAQASEFRDNVVVLAEKRHLRVIAER